MFQTNVGFLHVFVHEVVRTHLKDSISTEQANELWTVIQKLCMNGFENKERIWQRLQGMLCLCVRDGNVRLVIESVLRPSFSSPQSPSSPPPPPSPKVDDQRDWDHILNKRITEEPESCVCPITLDNLLIDGCVLDKDVAALKSHNNNTVHLFRHSALKRWFQLGSTKNPLTNCAIDPMRDVWVLS